MATQVPQTEAPSTPDQIAAARERTVEIPKSVAAPKTEAFAGTATATPADKTLKESATNENSHLKVGQFFALRDRLPIQVFNEETKLKKFLQVGPILLSIASIVLTFFVWRNTDKLTTQQLELQKQQTELQNDRVQAELADLRFKFLNDLTAIDEHKKTPAEISLAAHGLNAFPVIHSALGVEQGDIRRSAVNVVHRLFQAEKEDGRKELLKKLEEEFAFPNKTLHTGVVESFVNIEPLLSPEQRAQILAFLEQTVVPQNVCSDQEGRETVRIKP